MTSESKPLIVIVEDEIPLAKVIATHLEAADMRTQLCHRVEHALRFLQRNFANLVLLDMNLPDHPGIHLLEELKKSDIDVPIIFLTAVNQEPIKIKGLEMGADDYITKPFSYSELIARIKAVLRRTESKQDLNLTRNAKVSDAPFIFHGASVHPQRLEIVFPDGYTEKIGRKELGILLHLHSFTNVVVTRKSLIHSVWGQHADLKSRSLDQYVVKIRELYETHDIEMDHFKTVHGVGYIYESQ
jgi:DNA-binding response OmpR family regulator